MPTYTRNIPQPTDDPSQSQDQILQNFQSNYDAFSVDHQAFNSGTDGQHKQITFPVGPLAGQPFTYLVGQIGLQSRNVAPTSRPDIWMTRGTGTAFPITGYTIGGTNAGNGWTYLPSGALIAWGRTTTGGAANVTVTYATELTNFPGFSTAFFFPQLTRISAAGTSTDFVTLTAYNQTTFQVYSSAGGIAIQFAWLIIGL